MNKALPLLLLLCLSLSAQSLQPIASLDRTAAYAGSFPSTFTAFGDDVYALANTGELRVLVKMEQGSAAHPREVRYQNQTISALSLERHGDSLFAQVKHGMVVIDAPDATPRYLPTNPTWIGTATDGQVMVLDQDFMLHRYVRGVGLEQVGVLDDGSARLSVPFPYGHALYYLAYEVGGPIELRAITPSGERSLVATLGTADDVNLSFGDALATVADGELYVGFTHLFGMSQLWRTDGTAAGTHLVFEHDYAGNAPAFTSLVSWNQGIAFATATEANLFLYRHGLRETIAIDSSNGPLGRLTPLGPNLLFLTQGSIYRKGISGAPEWLTSGYLSYLNNRPLPVNNGRAYLFTDEGLWSSDGTSAGSRVRALTDYYYEGDPFPRQNVVWASGNRQSYDPELLILPDSGEPQVQELNPTIIDWHEHGPYLLGDHLLYRDPETYALHAVTGTDNIVLAPKVSVFLRQDANNLYYLKYVGPAYRTELWRTDGTQAGTTLLLNTAGDLSQPPLQEVYPSGNELYYTGKINEPVTVYRLRADGTREQLTGYSTNDFVLVADGQGGLYLSDQGGSERNLWHVAAGESTFRHLIGLAGDESEAPSFRMIGKRLWMRVVQACMDPSTKHMTLLSSDGTAEGTLTYLAGARAASLPFEIAGMAGMIVANDGSQGFALSDGSAPFDEDDLALSLNLEAALFPGVGFSQVFGTEEQDENQLWRYDLETGEALFLTALTAGLRPFQRVEVGETTLLMLAGQGLFELWQSDGSVAGTTLLGSFGSNAKRGQVLDDRFYFSARGPEGDLYQRLYVWSAATGVELVAASAALSQPENLAAVDGQLIFSADDHFHYGIYRLGNGSILPPVQLTAKRLAARGALIRVCAEQIPGASYSWQLNHATSMGPTNRASLLVRVPRQTEASVTVTVTLANGDVRQGSIELFSPEPAKRVPTNPLAANPRP